MGEVFHIGDRVRVRLDSDEAGRQGWFEGTVVRIDPYSRYRSFYWVEFDEESRAILGMNVISVFNPRNIKRA